MRDLGGAGIAADQLELGAERILQQHRVDVGIGARALAADGERLGQRCRPGLHRRGVPGDEDADLVGAAAEPGELGRVELRVGLPISGSIAMPRLKVPKDEAVLRRDVVEIVRGLRLPAPGMFCATSDGLPGICLPMWRASMRAKIS